MEACLLISNTNKPEERKNKILFINAMKEVKQEKSIANLEETHIQKIFMAYQNYQDIGGFCKVVEIEKVMEKGGSLNLSIYVSNVAEKEQINFADALKGWESSSAELKNSMTDLFGVLD